MGWLIEEPPVEGVIEIRADKFPEEVLQSLLKSPMPHLTIEIPVVYVRSGSLEVGLDKTAYTIEFNAYDIKIKETP